MHRMLPYEVIPTGYEYHGKRPKVHVHQLAASIQLQPIASVHSLYIYLSTCQLISPQLRLRSSPSNILKLPSKSDTQLCTIH